MATAINRGASRSSQGAPTGTLARRRTATREGGSSGSSKRATMQYYTDDSPGFKLSPVVVIGMSLGFIFFVTVLHVVAKIRG